jgi:hypothetical protein
MEMRNEVGEIVGASGGGKRVVSGVRVGAGNGGCQRLRRSSEVDESERRVIVCHLSVDPRAK